MSSDCLTVLHEHEPRVYDCLRGTASQHPDLDFLHVPHSACGDYAQEAITLRYRDMLALVDAAATRYANVGVVAGMRVALLLENRPDFFVHWFALNALGASAVPLNPDLQPPELAWILSHSGAALAVTLPGYLARLSAAAAALRVSVVTPDAVEPVAPLRNALKAELPVESDPAMAECALIYTSGTTGKPKGCVLHNEYFTMMGQRYLDRNGYVKLERERSRILTPLPMFHINAMANSTMGAVMSAGCVVQLDRFHPATWWRNVVSSRATGIHCLGVMPAILLQLPPCPEERAHAVRYGTAANVEPQHHRAFEERFGFPLIEGWAMTETGAGAAIAADHEPRHLGTRCIGRPSAAMDYRIVDDAGRDVGREESGELWVRHRGTDPRRGFFRGYLGDPDATEAAWAGDWWHTGDRVCEWSDGSLHFVDRQKNVIRRSGENISALEVEAVLREHPRVAAVAVTAVPDPVRGEEVFACIVPRVSARDGGYGAADAAASDVLEWSRGRMAYYKIPGWIAFADALPVTATQKLQRGTLRETAVRLVADGGCVDLRARKRRTPS